MVRPARPGGMIRAEDAMSPSIYDLGIDKLSRQDRLRLVDEILDTLRPADPGPVELSEAHWREIEDRLADADANPDDGLPWEEVLARLRTRHSGHLTSRDREGAAVEPV